MTTASESLKARMDLTGMLQMELALNRVLRREMQRSSRSGALYWAEVLMEGRLLLDALAGERVNAKRLVHEATPEWVGASTAHRIIRAWLAERLVEIETDPADRRAVLIRPTQKMIDRAASRRDGAESAMREMRRRSPAPGA